MRTPNPAPRSDAVVRPQDLTEARNRTANLRGALKVHAELAEREPILAQGIQVAIKTAMETYEHNVGPLLPIERMGFKQELIEATALVCEAVFLGVRALLDGDTAASAASGS